MSTRQRVLLRDVAERAGVNIATASRALSVDRNDLVQAETARRVREAARDLGYRPNSVARGLKTKRTHTVGVLIPDLTNPLYPPMVRAIDDVLSGEGYTPLIANTDNDPRRERLAFDALRARQADGFLVATARLRHRLLHDAFADGVPLILVGRTTLGPTLPSVALDEQLGMRLAVEHLADLVHRHIAYVAGPQNVSPGRERLRGFRRALTDLGLTFDDRLVQVADAFSADEGRRGCRAILDRGGDFTAIAAGNDLMALGCLDALAERGRACPRDVSVVGYNDMPFADRFSPALTTVRYRPYDIGARAARRMLLQLDDAEAKGAEPPVELLEPQLVVRSSTARSSA